jgi:tetratricopeptide (TPR) repeat protein
MNKGNALQSLGEIEQERGNTEKAIGYYEEAVKACDEAIRLNEKYATAYMNKGNALQRLGEIEQERGNTEKAIKYYEEAVKACDEAIGLNENYILAYTNKRVALRKLAGLEKGKNLWTKVYENYKALIGALKNINASGSLVVKYYPGCIEAFVKSSAFSAFELKKILCDFFYVIRACKEQGYIYKVAHILASSGVNLLEEEEFDSILCTRIYRDEFYPVYKGLKGMLDASEGI